MVLRIRLARFGKKHAPFYNIVVAHARYAHFAIALVNLTVQLPLSPTLTQPLPSLSPKSANKEERINIHTKY